MTPLDWVGSFLAIMLWVVGFLVLEVAQDETRAQLGISWDIFDNLGCLIEDWRSAGITILGLLILPVGAVSILGCVGLFIFYLINEVLSPFFFQHPTLVGVTDVIFLVNAILVVGIVVVTIKTGFIEIIGKKKDGWLKNGIKGIIERLKDGWVSGRIEEFDNHSGRGYIKRVFGPRAFLGRQNVKSWDDSLFLDKGDIVYMKLTCHKGAVPIVKEVKSKMKRDLEWVRGTIISLEEKANHAHGDIKIVNRSEHIPFSLEDAGYGEKLDKGDMVKFQVAVKRFGLRAAVNIRAVGPKSPPGIKGKKATPEIHTNISQRIEHGITESVPKKTEGGGGEERIASEQRRTQTMQEDPATVKQMPLKEDPAQPGEDQGTYERWWGTQVERIGTLALEVDENLRIQLLSLVQKLDGESEDTILRDVILSLSFCGDWLVREVISCAGHEPPKDFYDCIMRGGRGDSKKDIVGLKILSLVAQGYLHTIRLQRNEVAHNGPTPTIEEVRRSLVDFLSVVEWFYCIYEKGPQLTTLYTSPGVGQATPFHAAAGPQEPRPESGAQDGEPPKKQVAARVAELKEKIGQILNKAIGAMAAGDEAQIRNLQEQHNQLQKELDKLAPKEEPSPLRPVKSEGAEKTELTIPVAPSFLDIQTTRKPQQTGATSITLRQGEAREASEGRWSARGEKKRQTREREILEEQNKTAGVVQEATHKEAAIEEAKNKVYKVTGQYDQLPPLEQADVQVEMARKEAEFYKAKQEAAQAQKAIRDLKNPPQISEPAAEPKVDELAEHRRREALKTAKHEITAAEEQRRRQADRKVGEEEEKTLAETLRRARKDLHPFAYETKAGWYKRLVADLGEERANETMEEYEKYEQDQEKKR